MYFPPIFHPLSIIFTQPPNMLLGHIFQTEKYTPLYIFKIISKDIFPFIHYDVCTNIFSKKILKIYSHYLREDTQK